MEGPTTALSMGLMLSLSSLHCLPLALTTFHLFNQSELYMYRCHFLNICNLEI